MANYKKKKKKTPKKEVMTTTEAAVDQVLAFERFRSEIAPELQKDLINGMSPKQIFKKYKSYAAARMFTIALTAEDDGKAIAALKDILDRGDGKATETKKIEHILADAEEKDLDALILSQLDDVNTLEAEWSEVEDEDV